MKEIPCKDCICVPICRGKSMDELYIKCTLFSDYIEYPINIAEKLGLETYAYSISYDVACQILENRIDKYLNPIRRVNLSLEDLIRQEVRVCKMDLNKRSPKNFYKSVCDRVNKIYPFARADSKIVSQIIYKMRKEKGIKILSKNKK